MYLLRDIIKCLFGICNRNVIGSLGKEGECD